MAKQKKVRTGKETVLEIQKAATSFCNMLLEAAKENMIIHGRRNMKKEDVSNAIEQLRKEEKAIIDIAGK